VGARHSGDQTAQPAHLVRGITQGSCQPRGTNYSKDTPTNPPGTVQGTRRPARHGPPVFLTGVGVSIRILGVAAVTYRWRRTEQRVQPRAKRGSDPYSVTDAVKLGAPPRGGRRRGRWGARLEHQNTATIATHRGLTLTTHRNSFACALRAARKSAFLRIVLARKDPVWLRGYIETKHAGLRVRKQPNNPTEPETKR